SAENGFELMRIISIVLFGGRRLYSRHPSTNTATSPHRPVDPAIARSRAIISRGSSGRLFNALPDSTSADWFLRGSIDKPSDSVTLSETEMPIFMLTSSVFGRSRRMSTDEPNGRNPDAFTVIE